MPVSQRDFDFVRTVVREESAIVLNDGKEYLLETRLLPLVRREKFGSLDELIEKMRSNPHSALHDQVVDAMTTNETSFFRDESPFEALRTHIMPELLERPARPPIHLWCGACSTGQEPYSIAMVLREHFLTACAGVQILATDLSPTVVAKAQRGLFNSLEVRRGLPERLLKKYFAKEGRAWQIDASLQEMVKFGLMNLVQPWPPLPAFDVVFLRNVLIYFDVETKRAILAKIRRVLRPGGYLFLGSAETTLSLDDAFERVRCGASICYRTRV